MINLQRIKKELVIKASQLKIIHKLFKLIQEILNNKDLKKTMELIIILETVSIVNKLIVMENKILQSIIIINHKIKKSYNIVKILLLSFLMIIKLKMLLNKEHNILIVNLNLI